LKAAELEVFLGKQISRALLAAHGELAHRAATMRRKFAGVVAFIVPEIKLSDDLSLEPKAYQIKIHGTAVAKDELRIGDVLVIIGDGPRPDVPGDETREPAFGLKALWVPEALSSTLNREGFTPINPTTVLLTHLREVIRANLAQLLSYK